MAVSKMVCWYDVKIYIGSFRKKILWYKLKLEAVFGLGRNQRDMYWNFKFVEYFMHIVAQLISK